MYNELVSKKEKLAVVGLGYVGLPIALEFARKLSVIGFDIKPERVEMMKKGIDPSRELDSEAFKGCDIEFTSNVDDLRQAKFYVVAVPTPIDEHNLPDLKPLLAATRTVGQVLKKGDYVVYESTVYPGCTEEECVPLLEEISGFKYIQDFKVGFSPERINPGDKVHTLTTIKKITSGCDAESAEEIAKTYELIIEAGIHRASSIKVAEAAKIIENTQRDINIAFMNELSIIFNRMGINTYEVLEAAGTKWNFLKFFPGLVGGHCIGVDPYYLVYKAKELGYHPQIITAGRFINDSMGGYVAKQTVKKIIAADKNPKESRVLIMGVTFKENVSDIRNSKVIDIYNELKSFGIQNVDVIDPYADSKEVREEYGFETTSDPKGKYDAIIVAVSHDSYLKLEEEWFLNHANNDCVFVDVKGIFREKINRLTYWSL
ncbi:nucleotide sugar dehydrogenase [Tenuifilum thalassicum]|uniref:Nucleotide sugar dehydrogenase n=1 Tax=Tenuifilum thalassicum TaxID=2590900 RepID=A0A7D4BBU3_9BACT|nr:nucleotide sugar dehydrogenase [Tenuifilum thalassicum]QKG80240.1 nucleotide sugar dehydrogenase [Tenuifilum thalassicum]